MTSKFDFREFTSQRRFGVELETGGEISKLKIKNILKKISSHGSYTTRYQLTSSGPSWHIKDDATCGKLGRHGPKGVEIASFVGKGIDDINHIANVSQGLSDAGCKVNSNCGLHIHAEAKDISVDQLGIILAYWIKIEKVIKMSLPKRRWDNVYCKEMLDSCRLAGIINDNRNMAFSSEFMWFAMQPHDLSYYENEDRRVNLNLVNYFRARHMNSENRKTLELRWPEGTLSKRDVKNWVILFLNFIDTCKDLKMPKNLKSASIEEALEYLGLNHRKKVFSIFDENLHDVKAWFLERIITNKDFISLKSEPYEKDTTRFMILENAIIHFNKISDKTYQMSEVKSNLNKQLKQEIDKLEFLFSS